MSDFEAQCDCELDSPGVLSHLPVGERLKHWTDWALYLKRRIETHYRPGIAALEAELERVRELNGELAHANVLYIGSAKRLTEDRDHHRRVGEWFADKLKQAEAEVALRDRMLRDIIERIALTPERWNGWTTEEVLADLRAQAERREG